jgi:hypothetical protein
MEMSLTGRECLWTWKGIVITRDSSKKAFLTGMDVMLKRTLSMKGSLIKGTNMGGVQYHFLTKQGWRDSG